MSNSEKELAYLKKFVELVRSYDTESYEEFVDEVLKVRRSSLICSSLFVTKK